VLDDHWDILVVDGAGTLTAEFHGCTVQRVLNVYHGRKLDFVLRRVAADFVLICDDDRYLISDIAAFEEMLIRGCGAPVVSLAPRSYWLLRGPDGMLHKPMRSYCLLLDRRRFLHLGLRFRSPRVEAANRVPVGEAKHQPGYDTADFAHSRLLELGYTVPVAPDPAQHLVWFDGMSVASIVAQLGWTDSALDSLRIATHYKEGSVNGALLRSLYCRARFEQVYEVAFGTPPRHRLATTAEGIAGIVERNSALDDHERDRVLAYFAEVDARSARMKDVIGEASP